jgi:hypothetical protein
MNATEEFLHFTVVTSCKRCQYGEGCYCMCMQPLVKEVKCKCEKCVNCLPIVINCKHHHLIYFICLHFWQWVPNCVVDVSLMQETI